MSCEEAQELIPALVDNELSPSERSFVHGHLGACPNCRSLYAEEQALKSEIRRAAATLRAPADLRETIQAEVRLFSRTTESERPWKWPGRTATRPFRPAIAGAVALVILPAALYFAPAARPALSLAALRTHAGIEGGEIQVIRGQNPENLKEDLRRSAEGRFGPMGYDLSPMGLQPVGGFARELSGRRMLVVLYEGEGAALTCYTFLGTEKDAPKDARDFFDPDKRMHFYIFSRGEVTGILHREGKLICILIAKMPAEKLLALARSKARPASHFKS